MYRYIPADATEIKDEHSDGVVYTYSQAGGIYAIAYHGKAAKNDWHHRFRTEAARDKTISEFFAGRRATVALAEARRAERKNATSGLNVGDILVSSWGYEQTNIDYYQVIETPTEKTVVIRSIAKTFNETGWLCGKSTPCPGQFIGEPSRHRAMNGAIKINDYRSAHHLKPAADGTFASHYESSYA